jgi:hypothetical protein
MILGEARIHILNFPAELQLPLLLLGCYIMSIRAAISKGATPPGVRVDYINTSQVPNLLVAGH